MSTLGANFLISFEGYEVSAELASPPKGRFAKRNDIYPVISLDTRDEKLKEQLLEWIKNKGFKKDSIHFQQDVPNTFADTRSYGVMIRLSPDDLKDFSAELMEVFPSTSFFDRADQRVQEAILQSKPISSDVASLSIEDILGKSTTAIRTVTAAIAKRGKK